MRRSEAWFSNKNSQEALEEGVALYPTVVVVGPNSNAQPVTDRNSKGEEIFVVGKSEVGGDEVIG